MTEEHREEHDQHPCPHCGATVEAHVNFCPRCGAAQDPSRGVDLPTGPPPPIPEVGHIQTPPVPGVPPAATQDSATAWVGRGMGIGLGACIVGLIIIIGVPLILFVGCAILASSTN